MSLTKQIKDKKVNFEFNKEFINVFIKKIEDNNTEFLNKTLKELHPADSADLIENLIPEKRSRLIELEGFSLDLEFNPNVLSLNTYGFNPSELEIEGGLTGELNNSYELYVDVDDTIIKAAIYTTNEPYQGNGGNILFLEFAPLGNSGDSTVLNYNKVQVNEHAMKEQNYTSQVIYFGDLSSNNEYQLIPKGYHLSQNYPNPFNPITYIQYSIPHYDFITIDIINISGQIINTIVQSSHQPGNYEIMWDGTNQNGISVPSGIYFYKLDADEFISVKKLVLLK